MRQDACTAERCHLARVNDHQWNWLEYRAVEQHDGDLSKALRECIVWSRIAVEIFDAQNPHAKLDQLLSETKDEHGPWELVMDAEPDNET